MKVKSKHTHAPPSCTLQSAIIIKAENLNHWEGWHTWLAMANTRVSGTSKSSDIWEIPFYEGLAKRSEERENVMEEARVDWFKGIKHIFLWILGVGRFWV